MQYLADRKPDAGLAPANGTPACYRLQEMLVGDRFTAADAYLFVVTNWARSTKVDLSEFANLLAFQTRIAARPAVQAAMRAEGLIASDHRLTPATRRTRLWYYYHR